MKQTRKKKHGNDSTSKKIVAITVLIDLLAKIISLITLLIEWLDR